MNTPQPHALPVLGILSETAQLHWRHILVLFASAAIFASPIVWLFEPLLVEFQKIGPDTPPEEAMPLFGRLGVAYLVALVLSAILFTFWVRVTLLGPRLALVDTPANWPVRIFWSVSLFFAICLGTGAAIIPVTMLTVVLGPGTWLGQLVQSLLVVFVFCLFFAMLSRTMVERAMDIPSDSQPHHPHVTMPEHLRLAALFASVTFALFLLEGMIAGLLQAGGAELTVKVLSALSTTVVITIFASIHAIVYRMRAMQKPNGG